MLRAGRAVPARLPPDGASDLLVPSVLLEWEESTGAASYDVFFGPDDPPPLHRPAVAGTELLVGPLEPDTTSHWWVRARGGCGAVPSPSGPWRFATTSQPMSIARTSLRVARSGSDVTVSWETGCGAADDYTIHEGDLQALHAAAAYNHGSRVCADAGSDLRETFAAAGGDRYFLVVPRTADGVEGGYGPGRPRGADTAGCGITGWAPGACP